MVHEVETRSPAETQLLGERIGRLCRGGEVLGLTGDLGAGKTCFVRGLARGLALDPDVVYSPSFTLVAEHSGRLPLHHIDLFRLGEPLGGEEAEEIGLRELLDTRGVTAIEWSSKLGGGADTLSLRIDIDIGEGEHRRFRLSAPGSRGREILAALAD